MAEVPKAEDTSREVQAQIMQEFARRGGNSFLGGLAQRFGAAPTEDQVKKNGKEVGDVIGKAVENEGNSWLSGIVDYLKAGIKWLFSNPENKSFTEIVNGYHSERIGGAVRTALENDPRRAEFERTFGQDYATTFGDKTKERTFAALMNPDQQNPQPTTVAQNQPGQQAPAPFSPSFSGFIAGCGETLATACSFSLGTGAIPLAMVGLHTAPATPGFTRETSGLQVQQ